MAVDEGREEWNWVPPTLEELQAALPQYEILDQLGSGGMGAVYKARQASLDRMVAIKVLPQGLLEGKNADLHYDERFQQEARMLAKLNHPVISTVHDFGQAQNGLNFLVMEYVDGVNLQQYLKYRNGKMPLNEVLYVALQILDALEYAHERHILHRDIKPANILVRVDDGAVRLIDFGLAKMFKEKKSEAAFGPPSTVVDVVVGTIDFLPPEALEADGRPDHRGDLYALGVTLYQLLTGLLPKGKFTAVSGIIKHIDSGLDPVIERAIEMDPDDRYQSAADFRLAILEFMKGNEKPSSALNVKIAREAGNNLVLKTQEVQKKSAKEYRPISATQMAPAEGSSGKGKMAAVIAAFVLIALAAALLIVQPWSSDKKDEDSPPSEAKVEKKSPAENKKLGIKLDPGVPKYGRVRAWGMLSGQPIKADEIQRSFGTSTPFEEIIFGGNKITAWRERGDGVTVGLYSTNKSNKFEQIEAMHRENNVWIADGKIHHGQDIVNWDGAIQADKIILAGLFGYIGRTHTGELQLVGWEDAPGGREPMLQILSAMDTIGVEAMSYFYQGKEEDQRVTVLFSDNRIRTWKISPVFDVTEALIAQQAKEPLAEITAGGDQFGGWLARARSGNVYSEGTGGFSKPIKELSPAVKIRSTHGLVAAQRPDGSWVAQGPDNKITREMAAKINSLGIAPDLDFHYSQGYMNIIVWLEPQAGQE